MTRRASGVRVLMVSLLFQGTRPTLDDKMPRERSLPYT